MFRPTDVVEPDDERAAGDVIDGEAIIINLVTGAYYSMMGIGGAIWSMVGERRSVGSMIDEIVATYDVDPARAAEDLQAVLEGMHSEGLIRRSLVPGVPPAVVPAGTKRPYRSPSLQVFRDMEELLALDPPAPGMNQIAWKDGSGPGPK